MNLGPMLGHYDIIEPLGVGGMGEVYRARDRRLGRQVAVKILAPAASGSSDALVRFEQEARALAALQHPGIVTLYSTEEEAGIHFLTMELAEGPLLGELIPADGFEPDRFHGLAIQLIEALEAAHDHGVLHGDLKPSNIIVTPRGQLKVLDFGLARIFRQPRSAGGTPAESEALTGGTIPYMAPEVLQGAPADIRSEIFSLGTVLYEMATGRRAFEGSGPAAILSAVLHDDPPPITERRPDFVPAVAEIVTRCLAREPLARPATAGELRRLLEASREWQARAGGESRPSLAVLPFTDMSFEQDQRHFCEGLAEELINGLNRLGRLRVAPRTSAFLSRRGTADVREIGRQLNVQAILEGSVRLSGPRMRITAELTDVASGHLLWSERYDRELTDSFAVQDDIVTRIIEALSVALDPGEPARRGTAPTQLEAYDNYLRGLKFLYEFRRQGIELATQMFQRAIRHDPGFARAWAGLADGWCFRFLYAERQRESLEEADRTSLRALELGPELAEVWASRGQVLSLLGRHDESRDAFERALRLDPRLFEANYLYARDCFAQGEMIRAAELFQRAAEIRPDDYQSPLLVAQVYEHLNRPADAAAVRRRGVQLVEQRLRLDPRDVRAMYMGANGLMALGERERAIEWAGVAQELEPNEPMVLYNLGCIFSLAGEYDRAVECLARAAEAGLTQRGWFENDADLDPLRADPRFQAIMARMP